jgi:hypothetical protein
MTAFDRLCARVPLVAQQRHLIETDRTSDAMTQATAWHELAKSPEVPQAELFGTGLALEFKHGNERADDGSQV